MRIVRFSLPGTVAFGVLEAAGPGPGGMSGASVRPVRGHPYAELDLVDTAIPIESVKLLAPVLPSKIIGIGQNYADHAAEMGSQPPADPLIFLKPNTAVIGPGARIKLPEQSSRVEHEGELAVVIGRMCRHVAAVDADRVILGYTCGNDVTARDLQATDWQWTRAKGFDTFCPLGPWIETDFDPADSDVEVLVNDELRQRGSTSQMVFGVRELVSWVSSIMTLLPGDVILTGTPAGVGPLVEGDRVSVSIAGLGTLTNDVIAGE
ncbi:MAG: fumarylacetoacetate hydrolase family protein [Candidatus Nanopelagicales bacterium]|nr:fumarylacetoacetate hydrolase family protein [Candidatus Nanopelagicales bacterium]